MLFMLSSISPFLVRKVRLLMDCLHRNKASPPALCRIEKGKQSLTPAPLRRGRGGVSHGNGGIGYGVI